MEVITSSSLTSTLVLCPFPAPSLCPATPLGGGGPWKAQTQVHVRPHSSSNLLMHKFLIPRPLLRCPPARNLLPLRKIFPVGKILGESNSHLPTVSWGGAVWVRLWLSWTHSWGR